MSTNISVKKIGAFLLSLFAVILLSLSFCSISTDAAVSIKISSNISRTSFYPGGTATVTATVSGGEKPYRYRFAYQVNGGSWVYLNDYNSSPKISFVYDKVGKYTVRSFAKDNKNRSLSCDVSFTVEEEILPLKNTSSVDKTTVDLEDQITVYGKCTGGKAPYKYSYYYSGYGGVQKSFGTFDNDKPLKLRFDNPGYYTVKVIIKDSEGVSVTKRFSIICRDSTGQTLKNTSYLTVDKINLGSILHIKGAASGGTQPCMYAYYYSPDGKQYKKIAGYTQNFECSVKLPDIGTYKIKIIAKDLTGRSISKIVSVDSISNTKKAFSSKSTISTVKTVVVNTTVTMYGSAYGGTKPYKYAYYYRYGTENWISIKSFCTADNASVKLTKIGKYTLRIAVKDYSGRVINKTFSINTVSDAEAELIDTSQSMNVNYGDCAVITAPKESAGSLYSMHYRKSTDIVWAELQDFSDNRTVKFRPRETGTYQVKVTTITGEKTKSYIVNVYVEVSDDVYNELDIINKERKAAGLAAVSLDLDLTFVATIRAEELTLKYSHVRPDGSSCFSILDEYFVEYKSRATENIGWGYTSPETVMAAWMNSSGHRANILDKDVTKVGVGISGVNWAQVFSD